EERRTGRLDLGEGELDRDLGAVGANRRRLEATAEHVRLAALEVAGKTALVLLAERRRNDHVDDRPAERLAAAVAEGALRGGVPLDDRAARVDRDQAIEG